DIAPLPAFGGAQVAILDPLDKVQPLTGKMIPVQAPGYLAANHLWNADGKQIRLAAARNEFVAFQILLDGPVRGVRPSLMFDGESKGIRARFGRFRYVASDLGPLADPVVPLSGPVDVPSPDEDIPGLARGSLLCEVYVPHYATAGAHQGTLQLRTGSEALKIDVVLWVWDFTLPDVLSFLPEMNCYGLPENERDYYRLAHSHRTVLNRLPYSQRGTVADGCAPAWDGKKLDWSAWDRRFGPYLDGSAFADLPRSRVPLECFYLPLHENWPSRIEDHYNGSYWADQAFDAAYREAFVEVARQMAEHFESRGWHGTVFQCYLNNKSSFKRNGWSRGSSPWILDEPANFQDYWALRWFGEAFHEGVLGALGRSGGGAKLCFRGDVSRPQWQRDALDHVLDYNVVGGRAFRQYHRTVIDRKERFGQIVVDYGSANAVDQSNMQPVGWCLDSWTLGSDGVVPWQTIGNDGSWQRADRLSLFYPGRVVGEEGPVPSIRLKAFRRGQQDAEYLTLLAQALGEPRRSLGQAARRELDLAAQERGTGVTDAEDAGAMHYAALLPQDAWALRVRIGRAISEHHPEPKRQLVDLRTPRRDPAAAPPGYVAGQGPSAPESTGRGAPAGPTVLERLQGRQFVRDALIHPESPEKSFGGVTRDNQIVRQDACSAFLVRFDLDRVDLPADARVEKATVSFYVWDPSGTGNAKVCAFGLKTPWDEASATWQRPAADASWKGGGRFAFGCDTTEPVDRVIVPPDAGSDTVDPPLEYQLDVTTLVRNWLSGEMPNHGLAIASVVDRAVDDGQWTRLQVLASEYRQAQYTPKLEIHVGQ
ncbi:MAG TPA: DNRLRE domain-containing protein, partial [Thermoguttaceae bacterium]|nr:DNRLRE domain-containing protein [Thermoguttaceae bacterium]